MIVPAIVVAVAVWMARDDPDFPMAPILIGAAVGCLVLVLNSPVWATAPLLIAELTIANYQVEELGVSLRLALALAGLALTIRPLCQAVRPGDPRIRRVLLPALCFVLVATVINGLFSEFDYMFKYLRYQLVQLLTLLLVACLIRDRQDLRRVASVALGFGVLSAVAAIWQHVDRETAFYGMSQASWLNPWKGRALGLSDNPVVLANCMTFVLMPLLGFVVAGVTPGGRGRAVMLTAIVLTGVGLYFTFTRSAVLAAGPGLAAMALYLRGPRRTTMLGAIVALAVLYQAALGLGLVGARYSKNTNNDRSAASHEALLTVGLAVAQDNLALGIGHQHFEEISAEYTDVLGDSTQAGGAIAIGKERPHNDFLSIITSWGSGAFAAYLLILVGAFRNFAVAARGQDRFVRGLAIGCAGGLATYAANSFFHNYLDSSSAFWLYAGASVALARLPVGSPAITRLRPRPFRRPVTRRGRQFALAWG